MGELKRCPFCGGMGKVKKMKRVLQTYYRVECENKDNEACPMIVFTPWMIRERKAVEAWNKREKGWQSF